MSRHNKKRNPAIVYEALIVEMAKATIEENEKKVEFIRRLIKESYSTRRELGKEYRIYREMCDETSDATDEEYADMLTEAISRQSNLDQIKLNTEKSRLISLINKKLSKSVYNNPVANYRDYATLYQIMTPGATSIKEKLQIMETFVLRKTSVLRPKQFIPKDKLVLREFARNFNEHYSKELLVEQKTLIGKYITSKEDKLELKLYLNEEIGRLRKELEGVRESKLDDALKERSEAILQIVNDFSKKEIDDVLIETVLKIQELVSEIRKENDNS